MVGKLTSIIKGWANYIWESEDVREMAKERAKHCAKCDKAKMALVPTFIDDEIKDIYGLVCTGCGIVHCPLSGKLRSPDEKCPDNKWQARIK